jgi:hypothetical protein
MASRGSFWPPEMMSLVLAEMRSRPSPARSMTEMADRFGRGPQVWEHRVDMPVDGSGAVVAMRLDLRVARVVGAAVDHALAHAVHLGGGHVGEPGDQLQRLGRDRHRVVAHQVGLAPRARARRGWRRSARNSGAQVSVTVRGLRAGNSARRSERCASPSRRMRFSPIRRVIRPSGWREDRTSMRFSSRWISARLVKSTGIAKGGDTGDGSLGAQPGKIGVGVVPKGARGRCRKSALHDFRLTGPGTRMPRSMPSSVMGTMRSSKIWRIMPMDWV